MTTKFSHLLANTEFKFPGDDKIYNFVGWSGDYTRPDDKFFEYNYAFKGQPFQTFEDLTVWISPK